MYACVYISELKGNNNLFLAWYTTYIPTRHFGLVTRTVYNWCCFGPSLKLEAYGKTFPNTTPWLHFGLPNSTRTANYIYTSLWAMMAVSPIAINNVVLTRQNVLLGYPGTPYPLWKETDAKKAQPAKLYLKVYLNHASIFYI